jgi:hypothetical protein
MAHSLVQEMTMLTQFDSIERAEEELSRLKDLVQDEGADPIIILDEMGIRPLDTWIAELKGYDDLLDADDPAFANED